jgi:hypothetical protein
MTENGFHMQTISSKRTDFQSNCVLLLGQVKEKKEKVYTSQFLNFLLASCIKKAGECKFFIAFQIAIGRFADLSKNLKSYFLPSYQNNNFTTLKF